jgi:hypothetical protein
MHRQTGTGYIEEDGKRLSIDQNLGLGIPGTVDTAELQNALQEELCSVVENHGGSVHNTAEDDKADGWHQVDDTIFHARNIDVDAIDPLAAAKLAKACPGSALYHNIAMEYFGAHAGGIQMADPMGTPNYLAIPEEPLVDACLVRNATRKNFRLLLLAESGSVFPCDAPGDPVSAVALGDALALTFPETDPTLYAMCSDGDNFYVLWGKTTQNLRISKFSAIAFTGAPVWTRDTGVLTSVAAYTSKMIMCHYYFIAVTLDNGTGGVGFHGQNVGILRNDNGSWSIGHGQWSAGSGDGAEFPSLASDGTHVFWIEITRVGDQSNAYVLSAKISDPTTSDYAPKMIAGAATASRFAQCSDIICFGNLVVVAALDGSIWLYAPADDYAFKLGSLTTTAAPYNESGLYKTFVGSDYLGLWMLTVKRDSENDRNSAAFHRVDLGRLSSYAEPVSSPVDIPSAVVVTRYELDDAIYPGKFLYDSDAMWAIMRDGALMRITAPHTRK